MKTKEVDAGALMLLRSARQLRLITRQQYKTLRGQVLAGNSEGAAKGLNKILKKQAQA